MKKQSQCYFHRRAALRQRQIIRGRKLPLLNTLEDPSSIQFALMEVIARLSNGSLEPQAARLILQALRIASLNLRSGRFTPEGWEDLRPAAIARDAAKAHPEPVRQDLDEVFLAILTGDKAAAEFKRKVNATQEEIIVEAGNIARTRAEARFREYGDLPEAPMPKPLSNPYQYQFDEPVKENETTGQCDTPEHQPQTAHRTYNAPSEPVSYPRGQLRPTRFPDSF
jgi:hypothetical protein